MKMFKKVFAVVVCIAMLASTSMMSMAVSAEDAKTVVDGIRWFPCEEGRENDEIWEVECVKEGCLCQRFTDVPEETGNTNFLDTTYGEDGSLTITHNGVSGTDLYWPRIRTLSLEGYPELDITTANTLYFDFVAHENTSWNILLNFNGMSIKLSKVIADACGVSGVANSDADGAAGTYVGSVNLQDAIAEIAAESGTESSTFAAAIQNMSKTFVPQVSIFCVGVEGASITMNSLFISSADDTEGANCDYLDMGLIYGDEYYELAAGDDDASSDDASSDDASSDDADTSATTTTAAEKDKNDSSKTDDGEGGSSVIVIVAVILAVVVVAVVVVIVVKKKKA